ncbi:MAG: hypothetical protein KC609_09265, partial [Myxococcales bacterium]|nr:hypothetical protein [Myxococcales bacterium]
MTSFQPRECRSHRDSLTFLRKSVMSDRMEPVLFAKPTIFGPGEHSISRAQLDPDALRVVYRLYRAGHLAYVVGGGVRDLLLGRTPKDFDIGTDA